MRGQAGLDPWVQVWEKEKHLGGVEMGKASQQADQDRIITLMATRGAATVPEIAEAINRSDSHVYRMVRAMVDGGRLVKTAGRGGRDPAVYAESFDGGPETLDFCEPVKGIALVDMTIEQLEAEVMRRRSAAVKGLVDDVHAVLVRVSSLSRDETRALGDQLGAGTVAALDAAAAALQGQNRSGLA